MARPELPRPVAPGERILAIDVLRGFAMFGVLIAYCMWSLGTAPEEHWSRLDKSLGAFVGFAVDGKFYTILAFLFGLGFSIQLGRASNEAGAVRTYCRRLAALAAIGLLHALLLRNGDILFPYAITGFFLIPFRRAPDRVLLGAAVIALLVPHAARLLWESSGVPIPQRPKLESASYLVENLAWVRYWYETAIFTWPTNLTLFLFGFSAGRNRLITNLGERPKALLGIVIGGAFTGTICYLVSARLLLANNASWVDRSLAGLTFTFHCWGLSSCYAAALLLALRSRTDKIPLAPLGAIGRMALTNYLMQAASLVPLCLALGLFDTFTPTRSLLLALALFAVQLPFSIWWLRRFQFGPAEWVWRLLAYGRIPPLRAMSAA